MPRKGISQADLVQTAVCMIEEDGLAAFSLGKLAGKLGIRTASLYNHIESLEKLQELVGHEAVSRLVQAEWRAIDGKQGDLALFGLADAYRTFVREHYQLYRVIMSFPKWNNPTLDQEAGETVAPILAVLSGYGLEKEKQYHWSRVLRSVMAGFAFHEQAGGFSHFTVSRDTSYRIAIQCAADGLHQEREATAHETYGTIFV